MISCFFVLAALATGAAAETFSGTAKYHEAWAGTACGGEYDGTRYLMALNSVQYDAGPGLANDKAACGNTITVNFGGKSVVVTVVDRGSMGVNNFDLSRPAFEQLSPTDPGHIEVTWSWNDGFDPATGSQNKAGLAAVAINGKVGGSSTSAGAAAVGTSVASTAAVETSPIASAATAIATAADAAAAPADTSIASVSAVDPASVVPVASVDPSAAPVPAVTSASAAPVAPAVPAVSSAASSAAAGRPARPTGYRGGGRQSKRCAAQL